MTGRTCGDYARLLFHFANEAAGAASARLSLRPLFAEGQCDRRTRATHVAGMRTYASPSLRGAKRRGNPPIRLRRHGLLRFARNDDLTLLSSPGLTGRSSIPETLMIE